MTEQLKQKYLPLVITNLVTLACAYFLFAGEAYKSDSSQETAIYKATLERIESLEIKVASLSAQLMQSQIEKFEMMQQLGQEIDFIEASINLLDTFPIAAWMKEYISDEEITMITINQEYVNIFDISKARYQGASDYDVQPKRLADEFRKNDIEVMRTKSWVYQLEETQIKDKKTGLKRIQRFHVWKFYVPIPVGRHGIAGIAIPATTDPIL